MHAVLFQVDIKEGWQGDADAELDFVVAMTKATPGFVSGTWLGDDTTGISILMFDSEEAARSVVDNALIPDDASVTLRSVAAYEVVRQA